MTADPTISAQISGGNNFGILGTVIFYTTIAVIFGNNWNQESGYEAVSLIAVSYTHLRAHETRGNMVCRLED